MSPSGNPVIMFHKLNYQIAPFGNNRPTTSHFYG